MDKTSENSFSEGFDHRLKIWEDSDVLDDWVDRAVGYARIPDADGALSSDNLSRDIVVVSESKDSIVYRVAINSQDSHFFKSDTMINIDFSNGESIVLNFLQSSSAELAWKYICKVLGVNTESKCTKSSYESSTVVEETNRQGGKDDFDTFDGFTFNDASDDEPNFDSFDENHSKMSYSSLMDHDQESVGVDSVGWGSYQHDHNLTMDDHDSITLPHPEFTKIYKIRDLVRNANQDYLRTALIRNDASYLHDLFAETFLREMVELDDFDCLGAYYDIAYSLLEMRDNSVLECLLSEDVFLGFLGSLEYRPNAESLRFREFLQKKARFCQAVEISNERLIRLIHQTWRVRFLRDVVVPIITGGTEGQIHLFLSNFVSLIESEILLQIQSDIEFLRDIIACINDDDSTPPSGSASATPRRPASPSLSPQVSHQDGVLPSDATVDNRDSDAEMDKDAVETGKKSRGTMVALTSTKSEMQTAATLAHKMDTSLFDIIPTDFLPLEFVLSTDLQHDIHEDKGRNIFCPKFSLFSNCSDVYKKSDVRESNQVHDEGLKLVDNYTVSSGPATHSRRDALRFLVELFDLAKGQPASSREALYHTLFDPMSKMFPSLVKILSERNASAEDVQNVLTLLSYALTADKNLIRRQISDIVFSSKPIPEPAPRSEKASNTFSSSPSEEQDLLSLRPPSSDNSNHSETTMSLSQLEPLLRKSLGRIRSALMQLDDGASIRFADKVREYSSRINVYSALKIKIDQDRASYVTEEMLIEREQHFFSLLKLSNKSFLPLGEHGSVISLPNNCTSLMHLLVWRAVDDPCVQIQGKSIELLRNMMNMDGVASTLDEEDGMFRFQQFSRDFFSGPYKWMLFSFVHPELPQLKLMSPTFAMKCLPAVLKAQGIVLPDATIDKENYLEARQDARLTGFQSRQTPLVLTRFLSIEVIDRLAAGFSISPIPPFPGAKGVDVMPGSISADPLRNCTNTEKICFARNLYEALGMDVKMLRLVGSETLSTIHSRQVVSEFLIDAFIQFSDQSVIAARWTHGVESKLLRLLRYPQRTLVLTGIRLLKAFVNMDFSNFLTPKAFIERNLLSAYVATFLKTIAIPTGSAFDAGSMNSLSQPAGETVATGMELDAATSGRKKSAVENHSSVLAMLPNSTREAILARQRELGTDVQTGKRMLTAQDTNTLAISSDMESNQRMVTLRKKALFPHITLLGSAFLDFLKLLAKSPKRMIWNRFSKAYAPFLDLLLVMGLFPKELLTKESVPSVVSLTGYAHNGMGYVDEDMYEETDDYLDSEDDLDAFNDYEIYEDELLELANTSESERYIEESEPFASGDLSSTAGVPVRHGGASCATSSPTESLDSMESDDGAHLPSIRKRSDSSWSGDFFRDDEFDNDDGAGSISVFTKRWGGANLMSKQNKFRKVLAGSFDMPATLKDVPLSALDQSSPTKGTFTTLLCEQADNTEEDVGTPPSLPVKPLLLFPTSHAAAGIHDAHVLDSAAGGSNEDDRPDTSISADATSNETLATVGSDVVGLHTTMSTEVVESNEEPAMDDEWEQIVPLSDDDMPDDSFTLQSSASSVSATSELNVSLGALNTTFEDRLSPTSNSPADADTASPGNTTRSPLQFSLRKSLFSKAHPKTLFSADSDSSNFIQPLSNSLNPARSSTQSTTFHLSATSSVDPISDIAIETSMVATSSRGQDEKGDQFSFE